jgi:hypothetical protein
MSKRITGLVVGKDFRPHPGSPAEYDCYLTVDMTEVDRITVRVSPGQVSRAEVGDVIRFRPPNGNHSTVHRVVRLGSDPASLPLPDRSAS